MDYKNITAEVEVIGNIFQDPSLLESSKYFFTEKDFSTDLNRTIFGSIFNLYYNGVSKIEIKDIENYLKDKKKSLAIYETYEGRTFLTNTLEKISFSSFDYYYHRLKKFSLFRAYHKEAGIDLKWLYDMDCVLDVKKQEAQDKWLDETSLGEISDLIIGKINTIEDSVMLEEEGAHVFHSGDGIDELLEELEEEPDIGLSLYGDMRNGIHRGARKGCFYLRSAKSGIGKTRSMIADAGVLGCTEYYDENKREWIYTGKAQKVDYIIVEQPKRQIQILLLAFVSGVNTWRIESHIKELSKDERGRLEKAKQIIKNGGIYINELREYDIADLKRNISAGVRERNSEYFFFDYIENNVKMIEDMTKRTGGKLGLREDQILFLITNSLKEMAYENNIFIESATQLNGEWKNSEHMDSNMLAGGKAMDRKIDYGEIMLPVTPLDLEKISILLKSGYERPDLKNGIYKNRDGRINDHILWCKRDIGTCKIRPLFLTDYNYEVIELEEDFFTIEDENEEVVMEHIEIVHDKTKDNAFDEEDIKEYEDKKVEELIENTEEEDETQIEEVKNETQIEEVENEPAAFTFQF